jgi:PIN domain nuclease of toxin-antitoxin system
VLGAATSGVADIEAAVTDTHTLLYHAAASPRLGKRAAAYFTACEERKALVYVPTGVIWEIALLARSGHVNLRRTVRGFFEDLFSNPAYQPYDLSASQIYDADGLRFNRDPFDALICAAARDLGLPLLTRDQDIARSATVRVVW